jgi:HK97 family phage major capsid protein
MFVQLVKDFQGQKAGTRIDVTEADAKTLLDAGIAARVEGDQLAPLVQKSMEGMLAGITDTLTKSIDAVLKQFAEAHTKSNKNKVKAIFGEDGDGDPKKTFGRFLLAVMSKDSKTLDEMGSKFCDWDQKTAMATQTGTSGGFLVPTEFLAKLLSLLTKNSICRSLAAMIPMSARSVQIPALDVTTAPAAGDTAFLGGVVARDESAIG